jgi:hypothetical protein
MAPQGVSNAEFAARHRGPPYCRQASCPGRFGCPNQESNETARGVPFPAAHQSSMVFRRSDFKTKVPDYGSPVTGG